MPEERKTLYGHFNCVREKREGGKDPNANLLGDMFVIVALQSVSVFIEKNDCVDLNGADSRRRKCGIVCRFRLQSV